MLSMPINAAAAAPADDKVLLTRMGYHAGECFKALEAALSDPSTASMGKVLHFTADIVCSGGFALWQRFCYEYALDHIGLANPRIFHYLRGRLKELDAEYARIPSDQFYATIPIQQRISEIMLVLQASARRGKPKMPAVQANTHRNGDWLRSVRRAPDSSAVQKVWQRGIDMNELFVATNEMLNACTEGAIERALFWLKWIMEEEAIIKKESGSGASLTTAGRGIQGKPTGMHFVMATLTEAYKELAAKGSVRMNEEVQSILELYRLPTWVPRRRLDLLILMLQLLCEVPKWRTPAAPPVVKDAIPIQRAAQQSATFFSEVLAKAEPRKAIKKIALPKKKPGKVSAIETKLSAYDEVFKNYFETQSGVRL